MEVWRDELYHWGVKGMKWKKRKKTAAQEAEAAARSMEGAVRTADEEYAKYVNASGFRNDANLGNSNVARNRRHQVLNNDKNRFAIEKYTKKYNSAGSKAKRLVKDIFSGRAFSSQTTLKDPNGGVAATRTETKARGGKTVTIDNGKTRSTRYVPNPPKRKKKKKK